MFSNLYTISSPLDQFEIRDLITLELPVLSDLHLSITNITLYLLVNNILGLLLVSYNFNTLTLNNWSLTKESIYATINSFLINKISLKNVFKAYPFQSLGISPTPIYLSISLFSIASTAIMSMHGFSYASIFFFTSLISGVYSLALSFRGLVSKATCWGNHTLAVQRGLNMLIVSIYILSVVFMFIYELSYASLFFFTIWFPTSFSTILWFIDRLHKISAWFIDRVHMISAWFKEIISILYMLFRRNPLLFIYYTYYILVFIQCFILCLLFLFNSLGIFSFYMYQIYKSATVTLDINEYLASIDQFSQMSSTNIIGWTGICLETGVISDSLLSSFKIEDLISKSPLPDMSSFTTINPGTEGFGGGGGPGTPNSGAFISVDNNDNLEELKKWWFPSYDFRVSSQGLPIRGADELNGYVLLLGSRDREGCLQVFPVIENYLKYQESSVISGDTIYLSSAPFNLQASENPYNINFIYGINLKQQVSEYFNFYNNNNGPARYIDNNTQIYWADEENIADKFSRFRNLYHSYVIFAEEKGFKAGLNPVYFEFAMQQIEVSFQDQILLVLRKPVEELDIVLHNVQEFFYFYNGIKPENFVAHFPTSNYTSFGENDIYYNNNVTEINVNNLKNLFPSYLAGIEMDIEPADRCNIINYFMLVDPLHCDYLQHEYEQAVISSSPILKEVYLSDNLPTRSRSSSIHNSPILQEVYSSNNSPFTANPENNSQQSSAYSSKRKWDEVD